MKQWRCLICNFIHRGEKPPDVCPICGVPHTMFEELS
jgi:rubrerythrin